jgi:hypothetical protein
MMRVLVAEGRQFFPELLSPRLAHVGRDRIFFRRKGRVTIMTTRTSWPLWQPPNETVETIAEVIASHWNAAKAYRQKSFWPDAGSWLRAGYHFTKGGKLIR